MAVSLMVGGGCIIFIFERVVIPGDDNQIKYLNKKLDDTKDYFQVAQERDNLKGATNVLIQERDNNTARLQAMAKEMGNLLTKNMGVILHWPRQ